MSENAKAPIFGSYPASDEKSRNGRGRWLFRTLSALAVVGSITAAASAEARPMTEAEVVELAIVQNPSLRAAMADEASASYALRSAESAFVPIFGLDAGVTRSESPTLARQGVTTGETRTIDMGASLRKRFVTGTDLSLRLGGSYLLSRTSIPGSSDVFSMGPGYGLNLRLALVQPLWRGAGRDVGEAEIRTSRVRKTAAELARLRTANELLASVLDAYWELWYATETLAIQKRSLEVTMRQRDEARERAAVGSIAQVDVLAFETRVATRQEEIAVTKLEVERRQSELVRLLGQAETSIEPADQPFSPPPPPPQPEELALSASPELLEAEAAVRLAAVQAETADESLKPRLDLDAYAEARGLGNRDVAAAFGQLAGLGAVSAHVGLTFEAPVVDTQREAVAAQARLSVESASYRMAEIRDRVLAVLQAELAREKVARQRVELARETARIAALQVEAEEARYATGTATALSVLQAEDDLQNARLRVARAQVDWIQASTAIQRITGRLLARHAELVSATRELE